MSKIYFIKIHISLRALLQKVKVIADVRIVKHFNCSDHFYPPVCVNTSVSSLSSVLFVARNRFKLAKGTAPALSLLLIFKTKHCGTITVKPNS